MTHYAGGYWGIENEMAWLLFGTFSETAKKHRCYGYGNLCLLKNVNLDKVMKYALWEKAVLTVGTLTLAATGVIENEMALPKNGTYMAIRVQPNMEMDKLKWCLCSGNHNIVRSLQSFDMSNRNTCMGSTVYCNHWIRNCKTIS